MSVFQHHRIIVVTVTGGEEHVAKLTTENYCMKRTQVLQTKQNPKPTIPSSLAEASLQPSFVS